MPVDNNIGKIASAIEAGRRADASINRGPMISLNAMNNNNNKITADWHINTDDPTLFIFGISQWALPSLKVTK